MVIKWMQKTCFGYLIVALHESFFWYRGEDEVWAQMIGEEIFEKSWVRIPKKSCNEIVSSTYVFFIIHYQIFNTLWLGKSGNIA